MNQSKVESTQEKLSAISQFTGRVVHDLNNFSTIFINISELLKDDLKSNEDALLKLKMIEESANNLLVYTHDLNNLCLKKEHTESVADVNQVIDRLPPRARLKIIKSPINLLAKIDSERLSTILASLITNAQEASGQKEIVLEARRTAAGIEISVQDHGVGMSEEQLSHLCEPYYTSKQNVKGAGLSLSKAFGWLDNIGGSLSFTSKPGQGTCALLRIPQAHCCESPNVLSAMHGKTTA